MYHLHLVPQEAEAPRTGAALVVNHHSGARKRTGSSARIARALNH